MRFLVTRYPVRPAVYLDSGDSYLSKRPRCYTSWDTTIPAILHFPTDIRGMTMLSAQHPQLFHRDRPVILKRVDRIQPRGIRESVTATPLRSAAVAAFCLLVSACGPGVQPDRADTPSAAQAQHALLDFYGRWEGTPYRIGGSTRNGLDCSAFVQTAYRDLFAVDLPRTTKRQAGRGERVRRTRLQSGDLVFFKTGWFERHVGIYVGDGAFIHASTSKGVTRSSLADSYWSKRYWKSVRVAPF